MALWAGIDEAGYGSLLGPLVVGETVFRVPGTPKEGFLWDALNDAVTRKFKKADGRLVVNDSKLVYSHARGLRPLEEGVLGFLGTLGERPTCAAHLFAALLGAECAAEDGSPWFRDVSRVTLPRESNLPALASKSAALSEVFLKTDVSFLGARASVVLPPEFNRMIELTGNKSYLLFQKCGLLLQSLWRMGAGEETFVLVDKHGGRMRYRKLLKDAFPECACDVARESEEGSVYRLSDGKQIMWIAFKERADQLELPVSLASMVAKYVREIYMLAFNAYWQGRVKALRPTAGYVQDGRRFLKDIAPLLKRDGLDRSTLVRQA